MSKKDQCKAIMAKLFGPSSAAIVDSMTEEDCVEKCKTKVTAMMGETEAKEFDSIA